MKNMKMSAKITIIIVIVLAVLLTVLTLITVRQSNSALEDAQTTRFAEAAESRAKLLDEYMTELNLYMRNFAASQPVKNVLLSSDSETEIAVGQDYTEQYASSMDGIDGLFINNYDTLQLCHCKPEAVGSYSISDADTLKTFQGLLDNMYATGEGIFRGISVSPTTGNQVIVYYYPVFDDSGNGIGYVGIALSSDYLISILTEVPMYNMDNASLSIIQTTNNYYVYDADDELINTEVADQGILDIITEATSATAVTDESGNAMPISGSSTYSYNGKNTYSAYVYNGDYNILFMMSDTTAEMYAGATSLTRMVIIISVIVAIVMALVTMFVVNFLVKDLTKVANIVQEVGDSLDLSKGKELNQFKGRRDEVGILAAATADLCIAVRRAVIALQEKGKQLAQTAESLAEVSSQTLTNVNQVESAVSDIAEGATSQATETERASGNVVDMGNQIVDAADATQTIMKTSEEMIDASRSVTEVIDKLVAIGEQTSASIDEIYEQVNTTNNSAVKIRQATEIITGIAEETNLLSLNASIEAARAGEQGKGFAVVASQIQKLAEQSSQSAQQIEAVIAQLIADSDKSVQTMEEVKNIMVQQSEYVNQTGEIFSQVREGIDQTVAGLDEISNRTSAMDASRQSVVDVVENLSAIAEENAASTEETSASVTIVNDLMTDISDSASSVSGIAEEMDKELSVFTV